MNTRVSPSLRGLGLVLILVLGLAVPVQAVPRTDAGGTDRTSETRAVAPFTPLAVVPDPAEGFAQANGQVSLNQAVAQVQRRTGGRVLSAETQTHNGTTVHVIRVLVDNQRVRTIRVDAQSGEWL